MKITRKSMLTGLTHTLDIPVTEEQIADWQAGSFIQDAMPDISPDDREFIMNGVTPQEWDLAFGKEEKE